MYLESRAENELRERIERTHTILIENNKICSLSELIEKMKGEVPADVHDIVAGSSSVSLVSLTFDILTKYCLRVNSDLSFHITCNYVFLHFSPGTKTKPTESINSDLQRGLDRRLRHTQH